MVVRRKRVEKYAFKKKTHKCGRGLSLCCDLSCSWLSILLMLAYMGTVLVILLNILIAQMSTTYTQAKRVARLEYDVDRIVLLTRMERFPLLVCKRHGMNRVQRVCAHATFRDLHCVFQRCPGEPSRALARDIEHGEV